MSISKVNQSEVVACLIKQNGNYGHLLPFPSESAVLPHSSIACDLIFVALI
jgi:hypothetical protein